MLKLKTCNSISISIHLRCESLQFNFNFNFIFDIFWICQDASAMNQRNFGFVFVQPIHLTKITFSRILSDLLVFYFWCLLNQSMIFFTYFGPVRTHLQWTREISDMFLLKQFILQRWPFHVFTQTSLSSTSDVFEISLWYFSYILGLSQRVCNEPEKIRICFFQTIHLTKITFPCSLSDLLVFYFWCL